ncbi:hypothetical protein ACCO45_006818 [Purpureocillium lilacinum]|uniref:Uncharacterized protein n=1 Tax=Purpureocillium lilacinum TaxID=33203 RepID=A0ACC4DQY8_PURLI
MEPFCLLSCPVSRPHQIPETSTAATLREVRIGSRSRSRRSHIEQVRPLMPSSRPEGLGGRSHPSIPPPGFLSRPPRPRPGRGSAYSCIPVFAVDRRPRGQQRDGPLMTTTGDRSPGGGFPHTLCLLIAAASAGIRGRSLAGCGSWGPSSSNRNADVPTGPSTIDKKACLAPVPGTTARPNVVAAHSWIWTPPVVVDRRSRLVGRPASSRQPVPHSVASLGHAHGMAWLARSTTQSVSGIFVKALCGVTATPTASSYGMQRSKSCGRCEQRSARR